MWRHFRFPCMLFNYALAFSIFLPAYVNSPDQAIGLRKVFDLLPELSDSVKAMPIFVIATEFSMVVGPVLFMGAFVLAQAMTFVLMMYLGTQKAIKLMTISLNTLNMHKKFLRALYIQVTLL
uniref:RSN1_7TM domain-containing protein n=1 Tax=Caenorhabditis tropicalis TaxID=1561998 RepID=A0A1I7TVZ5_9PELO